MGDTNGLQGQRDSGDHSVKEAENVNRVHDRCSLLHADIIQRMGRYIYASNPVSMPTKNQLCSKQDVVLQRMIRLPRRDRLDKLFCLRTNPP